MRESAKRDHIADRIATLCAQMEAEEEADTDEEAIALVERNTDRLDRMNDLMADLAARRIRNRGDLQRRSKVLLAYLACVYGADRRNCFVAAALAEIADYAGRSRGSSKLIAACVASFIL